MRGWRARASGAAGASLGAVPRRRGSGGRAAGGSSRASSPIARRVRHRRRPAAGPARGSAICARQPHARAEAAWLELDQAGGQLALPFDARLGGQARDADLAERPPSASAPAPPSSLSSAHSSGTDLTSVRCVWTAPMHPGICARRRESCRGIAVSAAGGCRTPRAWRRRPRPAWRGRAAPRGSA